MQLGSRWSVGATPPKGLPDDVLAEISRVESGLPADTTRRWTLTWLEGRPVVDLDPDPDSPDPDSPDLAE